MIWLGLHDRMVSGTNTLYICFVMVHREEEEKKDGGKGKPAKGQSMDTLKTHGKLCRTRVG